MSEKFLLKAQWLCEPAQQTDTLYRTHMKGWLQQSREEPNEMIQELKMILAGTKPATEKMGVFNIVHVSQCGGKQNQHQQ